MWGGGAWGGSSNVAENVFKCTLTQLQPSCVHPGVTLAGNGTLAGLACALGAQPTAEQRARLLTEIRASVWQTDGFPSSVICVLDLL